MLIDLDDSLELHVRFCSGERGVAGLEGSFGPSALVRAGLKDDLLLWRSVVEQCVVFADGEVCVAIVFRFGSLSLISFLSVCSDNRRFPYGRVAGGVDAPWLITGFVSEFETLLVALTNRAL
jgi:hypothetical protein